MRTLNISIVFAVLLSSTPALAADGGSDNTTIDWLLAIVDKGFSNALNAVQSSPLDKDQQSTVSNVLKTKHDTMKNSVRNIR